MRNRQYQFDPSKLKASMIDLALRAEMEAADLHDPFSVLLEARYGVSEAELLECVPGAVRVGEASRGLYKARLSKKEVLRLERRAAATLHRIWLNHTVRALTSKSAATIKADAALAAFRASGRGIVWAVADSGVAEHAHFDKYGNLTLPPGVEHKDFTGGASPLTDEFGHGTHVAGIVAGEMGEARGMAPEAKIVSLKVLGADGAGEVSDVLAAIDHIQRMNDHGRRNLVQGVNLSLGYDFDPEWFACGSSPLCVELDRLVHSGVVVVVAAGNSGYGYQNSAHTGMTASCLDLTINDPGNAELAITVGSTHREAPHTYGVSYFSSKGPTGDGRRKPDLVAPGERIVSCAAPGKAADKAGWRTAYVEDSGTSMAAPHVSGAIAAFLSVRREFCGQPLAVKELFMETATDLRREPTFQGRGLVNLFQALQER